MYKIYRESLQIEHFVAFKNIQTDRGEERGRGRKRERESSFLLWQKANLTRDIFKVKKGKKIFLVRLKSSCRSVGSVKGFIKEVEQARARGYAIFGDMADQRLKGRTNF